MTRLLFLSRLWRCVDDLILIWTRLVSVRSYLDVLAVKLMAAEDSGQDVPFVLSLQHVGTLSSIVRALLRILAKFPAA